MEEKKLMSVFFTECKGMLGDRKRNMNGYGIKNTALETRSAVKEKLEKTATSPRYLIQRM